MLGGSRQLLAPCRLQLCLRSEQAAHLGAAVYLSCLKAQGICLQPLLCRQPCTSHLDTHERMSILPGYWDRLPLHDHHGRGLT